MIFRYLNSVATGDKEKSLWLPLAWEDSKKEDYLEVRKMMVTKEINKSECHGECFVRKLYRDETICAETDQTLDGFCSGDGFVSWCVISDQDGR